MRIKITVEYDGANYFGWQMQKGQITVQQVIEEALKVLYKEPIRITASGRTDSGVHARNQVVHFDVPTADPFRLKRSLNGLLPRDVVVKSCEQTDETFHARFSALSRKYRYTIATNPTALDRRFVWTVHSALNLALMQRGAEIIGRQADFQAFCKVRSDVDHYKCQIFESCWTAGEERLVYHIRANRFLHGMVRAIVGTLIEVGRGKLTIKELHNIIEKKDRRLLPATAPAQGLVLEKVYYDDKYDDKEFSR